MKASVPFHKYVTFFRFSVGAPCVSFGCLLSFSKSSIGFGSLRLPSFVHAATLLRTHSNDEFVILRLGGLGG